MINNFNHNCRFCRKEFAINITDEDIKVVCPFCGRQDGYLSANFNAIKKEGPLFKNKREEVLWNIHATFVTIPINEIKIILLKIKINYLKICDKILKCFIDDDKGEY